MEIQGYENYLIYEDGRVYSKKRNIFLKLLLDGDKYYRVTLCKDGKRIYKSIHRLLALHYIPNPDNKPCIDHIDRNRQNNDICNLRWVTHKENSNNCSISKNNTSGHTNISYVKPKNLWKFQKVGYPTKYFKTIDEAIDYKLSRTPKPR